MAKRPLPGDRDEGGRPAKAARPAAVAAAEVQVDPIKAGPLRDALAVLEETRRRVAAGTARFNLDVETAADTYVEHMAAYAAARKYEEAPLLERQRDYMALVYWWLGLGASGGSLDFGPRTRPLADEAALNTVRAWMRAVGDEYATLAADTGATPWLLEAATGTSRVRIDSSRSRPLLFFFDNLQGAELQALFGWRDKVLLKSQVLRISGMRSVLSLYTVKENAGPLSGILTLLGQGAAPDADMRLDMSDTSVFQTLVSQPTIELFDNFFMGILLRRLLTAFEFVATPHFAVAHDAFAGPDLAVPGGRGFVDPASTQDDGEEDSIVLYTVTERADVTVGKMLASADSPIVRLPTPTVPRTLRGTPADAMDRVPELIALGHARRAARQRIYGAWLAQVAHAREAAALGLGMVEHGDMHVLNVMLARIDRKSVV